MDDHYSGNVLRPLGLKACVRVSFSHYNTEAEVAQFLTAMNEASACRSLDSKPPPPIVLSSISD
jgi:selenocysteine lyase/cysteine desulfurase